MSLEIIHDCGLARNGRLKTSHGIATTPTIFPVHDLGSSSGWNTPHYWKAFPEINTAMFNASLIKTDVRNRLEAVLKKGVHKYAGYKGIAFLDSGGWTYKKHNLGYTQEEILRLQERIGADIASSLDFPVRLMDGPSNQNITASIHNAMWVAKNKKRDKMLIFASIHGSDPTIIRNIIRYLNKKADFDGFAIGSLLPIFSNYQLLIDIILSARKELLTKPLHVYGLAGPIISELLAFLGVDMMDSSSFVISAAKKCYFVPNFKRMQIRDVSLHLHSKSKPRSSSLLLNNCSCKVCINHSINDLIKSRELLSFHNLLVSWNQIKQFRLALTEKRLDQYLQVRFSKTPWARKAFEYAKHRIRYGGVS